MDKPLDGESQELIGDLGNLESALQNIDKVLTKLTESASKFTQALGKSTGTSSTPSGGQFTNGGTGSSGPNFLNDSLASVAPFMKMNATRSLWAGLFGGAVRIGTGLLGGAVAGMPDVNASIGMATGEYTAGVLASQSWRKVGSATFSYLNGGMNIAGAQGIVAASLANQGIQFGGGTLAGGAGQFANISRSVAGAARLLNISNDQAAAGIGNTYSGSTSMGLLQNFGIYTTNPNGGKSASPTQILAMMNDRLTGGGRMNYKQVQTALGPGGLLTSDIQNSGLSPEMQQMLRAYMLQAAKGNYLNFDNSSSKAVQKAMSLAGGNPQAANMAITSATSGTMQAASEAYVTGMNNATKTIVNMQKSITDLIHGPLKGFAQMLGMINLAGKSTAGAGLGIAAGGLMGGLGQIAGGILGYKALKGLFGGGAAAAKGASSLGSKLKSVGKGGLWALGGTLVGEGIKTATGNQQGSVGNKIGNALSTAGQWAGMASLLNVFGPEVGIPAMAIAGLAGGVVGGFSGGAKNSVATGGMTDTTGTVKLVAPVKGPITTKYGQTTDVHGTKLWGGRAHLAIDYGVPVGTVVQAAGDGKVSETGSGSGDRSYGNYIIIDHGQGYSTLYAHLSSIEVAKGDQVQQGQRIGLSGDTGYVTGPHLHFETRKNGQPVNPASLGLGAAVAVIAGNVNSTAGSNTDGSIGAVGGGSAGSAGSLGYSSGAANIQLPNSYSGASYGRVGGGAMASGNGRSSSSAAMGHSGGGGVSSGGQGGPGLTSGKTPPNVQIYLTIAQASDDEAHRFAKVVQNILEDKKLATNMGRF